jgi:hypothetical protein
MGGIMPARKLIKNIPPRYRILDQNGWYLLYDKEMPSTMAYAHYVGKFKISEDGKKYSYNGELFTDFGSMLKAMDKHNATLPFDIEIYDPSIRKSHMIELAVGIYLESLGFVLRHEVGERKRYTLTNDFGEVVCEVFPDVEFDTTNGKLTRNISNYKWVEAPFTDMDSAISACNSLVIPYLSCTNALTMNVMEKSTKSRSAKLIEKTLDIKTLGIYIEDAKLKTIKYLEDELKRLKGDNV